MKYFILAALVGVIGFYYFQSVLEDEPYIEPGLESSSLKVIVYTEQGIKNGSSVVFDEDDDHYYLLTNHHVVDGYVSITLTDYLKTTYTASIYPHSMQSIYDLAILVIEKVNELKVLKISDHYDQGDVVSALGFPNGIYQMTYGQIEAIDKVVHEISFEVIYHSAITYKGSSGGALVNNKDEIIGINFGKINDADVVEGYAVPGNQILEYLSIIGYGYT